MKLEQQYLAELEKLSGDARRFGEQFPDSAHGLATPDNYRPEIRQLLQGVAYLTATLQQRVAIESSLLAYQQAEMFAPDYIRGLPAITVLEFQPRGGAAGRALGVPAGVEVATSHQRTESCRFATTRPITVPDIEVVSTEFVHKQHGQAYLSICLALSRQRFSSRSIEFFVAGPYRLAATIFEHITRRTCKVEYFIDGEPAGVLPAQTVKTRQLQPLDFELTEYPDALRLLQQYAALPESLLFFELDGLQQLTQLEGQSLEFRLFSHNPTPSGAHGLRDFLRVGCVPAVNLFAVGGQPITMVEHCHEYCLEPTRENTRVFAVREASVSRPASRGRLPLVRGLPARQHETKDACAGRYTTARLPGEPFLVLQLEPSGSLEPGDVISTELLCQTSPQALDKLRTGDICVPTANTPPMLAATNISRVSRGLAPCVDYGPTWDLLGWHARRQSAQLSKSLLDQAIKLMVPGSHGLKLAAAIQRSEFEPVYRAIRGQVRQVLMCRVQLASECLAGRGDAWVFSRVLQVLIADSVSFATQVECEVRVTGLRDNIQFHL